MPFLRLLFVLFPQTCQAFSRRRVSRTVPGTNDVWSPTPPPPLISDPQYSGIGIFSSTSPPPYFFVVNFVAISEVNSVTKQPTFTIFIRFFFKKLEIDSTSWDPESGRASNLHQTDIASGDLPGAFRGYAGSCHLQASMDHTSRMHPLSFEGVERRNLQKFCRKVVRSRFTLIRKKTARKPSHQKGPRSEHATISSVRTGKRAAVVRTMQD